MMSTIEPSTRSKSNDLSWNGFSTRSMPEVPSWIESLGRAGYIAKGIVYFIIGLLAFKLAIGAGGETAGSREAIREIGQQPFGRILLGLVTVGLLSYCFWRLVQAVKDTEGAGSDAKGIAKRLGYTFSGLVYGALGLFAGSLALGMAGSSQSNGGSMTGALLESQWGRVLLGVAGAITIGVALHLIYKAYQAKFMADYHLAQMSESIRKAALNVGRIGLSTRGLAFVIIGIFILMSAIRGTSDGEIAGMSDALAAIAAQSYGQILIGFAGFGLMCYAVHTMLMGWYRKFNVA